MEVSSSGSSEAAPGARSPGGGWFKLSNRVLDMLPEIGPSAMGVLLVLARHADHESRCWPRIETLAAQAGLSRRSTQLCLQTLRNANLVTVEARYGKQGQRANCYKLAEWAFPPRTPVRGRNGLRGGGAMDCAQNKTIDLTRGGEAFDHVDSCVSEDWQYQFLALLNILPPFSDEIDHAFVGQLAWLLVHGGVDLWDEIRDACTAAREVEPRPDNPIAYVRSILMKEIGRETLAAYLRMAPPASKARLRKPEPYQRLSVTKDDREVA